MAKEEMNNQDYIKKWTDDGIEQLFDYMETYRPTLQTTKPNDPLVLAQEFQHTIDQERDPRFRKIMGSEGEKTLNKLVPKRLDIRLSLITTRLIVLTMEEDGLQINDYRTSTFITGHLDEFSFEDAERKDYVERDWLSVKLIRPEFLLPRPEPDSPSEKPVIAVSPASKYAIPVDAVKGRLYNPDF